MYLSFGTLEWALSPQRRGGFGAVPDAGREEGKGSGRGPAWQKSGEDLVLELEEVFTVLVTCAGRSAWGSLTCLCGSSLITREQPLLDLGSVWVAGPAGRRKTERDRWGPRRRPRLTCVAPPDVGLAGRGMGRGSRDEMELEMWTRTRAWQVTHKARSGARRK